MKHLTVTRDTATKRNLSLLNEFMKYAFDNPQILDTIPPGAEVIIFPLGDRELHDYNQKMADKMLARGKKVVIVRMKEPEQAVLELELMKTGTC
jgi:hypothetical protein